MVSGAGEDRGEVEKPWRVLVVVLVVLALALPGLARLRVRTDGRSLVPTDSPEARADRSIQAEFGVRDPIVAVVETYAAGGIFQPHTLRHIAALSRAFAEIPGVDPADVVSLATEPGDHVFPGTLQFRSWLDPLPESERECGELERAVSRARIYRGTLISNDQPASAAAILIGVAPEVDREALCARLHAAIDAHPASGDRVRLIGAAVVESELGAHLLADLTRLVPIALLVMAAILYACFRRLVIVALALAGAGVSLAVTLGAMGWCGVPVYLTCLVVPVILTAVGVAYSIHVYDAYLRQRSRWVNSREALRAAVLEMRRPTIGTSVTTAVGFLSFALSPIPAVRVFGLAMSFGDVVCMLWALYALPAALAVLPIEAAGVDSAAGPRAARARLATACAAWAPRLLAHRRLALVLFAALAVAALLGVRRLRIHDSWVEGFSPESTLRRDTARFDALFAGTHLLRVRVANDTEGARGRLSRNDFDRVSALVPGVLADPPARLVHFLFELTPVAGSGEDRSDARPLCLEVIDARLEQGGTRLFLSKPDLPTVGVRDLLPADTSEFDYRLDARDRLRRPAMIEVLRAFEEHLGAVPGTGVGAALGPWSHLSTLNEMLGADPTRVRNMLAEHSGIERTLELYRRARGDRRLHQVYAPDFDHALVTVLVRDASYDSVATLLAELEDYERRHLAPLGLRLDLGGDLALSQAMITGVVRTQLYSLGASLVGIVLVAALVVRSLAVGLLCAVPCAVAVIASFAMMGWLSIPLGVATSMFAGMTIGIGVDYAIHLAVRLRRETGVSADEALSRALIDVGPAIVIDALTVGAGFGVLAFSTVPPNARLGALLVTTIAACLVGTLVLMPPLLGAVARSWRADYRPAERH